MFFIRETRAPADFSTFGWRKLYYDRKGTYCSFNGSGLRAVARFKTDSLASKGQRVFARVRE